MQLKIFQASGALPTPTEPHGCDFHILIKHQSSGYFWIQAIITPFAKSHTEKCVFITPFAKSHWKVCV